MGFNSGLKGLNIIPSHSLLYISHAMFKAQFTVHTTNTAQGGRDGVTIALLASDP
jgi:hypothetical protein